MGLTGDEDIADLLGALGFGRLVAVELVVVGGAADFGPDEVHRGGGEKDPDDYHEDDI